jgi:hypothetical protein
MRSLVVLSSVLAVLGCGSAAAAASPEEACALELITHGTFHVQSDTCLTLVDDLATVYEIVDFPVYDDIDGLTGTIYADFVGEGTCTTAPAVRICNLARDYTRRVRGELVFLNNIECPGYVVRTSLADFLIRNCEDFGDDVCVPENLGRHLRATVFVDTGVSICLGLERSTLLDYAFFAE